MDRIAAPAGLHELRGGPDDDAHLAARMRCGEPHDYRPVAEIPLTAFEAEAGRMYTDADLHELWQQAKPARGELGIHCVEASWAYMQEMRRFGNELGLGRVTRTTTGELLPQAFAWTKPLDQLSRRELESMTEQTVQGAMQLWERDEIQRYRTNQNAESTLAYIRLQSMTRAAYQNRDRLPEPIPPTARDFLNNGNGTGVHSYWLGMELIPRLLSRVPGKEITRTECLAIARNSIGLFRAIAAGNVDRSTPLLQALELPDDGGFNPDCFVLTGKGEQAQICLTDEAYRTLHAAKEATPIINRKLQGKTIHCLGMQARGINGKSVFDELYDYVLFVADNTYFQRFAA